MKLRCTENSIRIRVRKSDLTQLEQQGEIVESIQFPAGNQFSFALKIDSNTQITASFQNGLVSVSLPELIARNWIETNEVSLETEQPLEQGTNLHLLIEKDFPCKDRPDEDKSDTFQELASESNQVC